MLTALELENFKAFGERTRIEFAPITLIFGENSAGKSSILQALSLLKQTRAGREQGAVLLPRAEIGLVDLGSYQDLLFDHDLDRDLAFTLELDEAAVRRVGDESNVLPEHLPGPIGFKTTFTRPTPADEIMLKSIEISRSKSRQRLALFETQHDGHTAARFDRTTRSSCTRRAATAFEPSQFGAFRLVQRLAKCVWVTDDSQIWSKIWENASSAAGSIAELLELTATSADPQLVTLKEVLLRCRAEGTFLKTELASLETGLAELKKESKPHSDECVSQIYQREVLERRLEDIESQITVTEEAFQEQKRMRLQAKLPLGPRIALDDSEAESIADAIAFYHSAFSMPSFIERMCKAELGSQILLDGFIPEKAWPRHQTVLPEFRIGDHLTESAHQKTRSLTLDVGTLAIAAGRALDVMLACIYPMGPFRRPPERWYVFTGTTPRDVGYRGELLPDLLFRREDVLVEANDWLGRLGIGYQLDVQPVGSQGSDLFEVRLVDNRRNEPIDVALSDVGFGVSQILPFVVQSLAGESQTITIEQPEVHIHPRLQANIGDLLIHAIQEPRSNRFIVETHSEHLILRLLRRIRETTNGELPSGHPGLKPDQISVIYVERGENGSKAHRLRIDESGEFVDRWPRGFFEERAKELF